ncbi:Acg family FMN-binding oxidoreductase [Mycobacterium sp.]|uniref:Acg family FMN-binding oxidoreductase n=1 Tax=Mycobacterium sp. TaxID=1785 RepID=UPI003F9D21D6
MTTPLVEAEVIEAAVESACRAPSQHNSQPWQWVFSSGELRLFLDPSRVMDTDQSAREALIGCGAALDHLRVAMAAAGWRAHVDRFPNLDNQNHLASIHFTPIEYMTERDRRRASAIWERHTDRLPFSAPTDWKSFEPVMSSSVDGGAIHINIIPEDLRPRLVEAAQMAESLRLYDTSYHDELHWWTAPFEAAEGIPHSSLVSAAESDRVGVGRVFPVVGRPERRTEISEDHSMILVLSTDHDSRADALASGEALSATLLECTMAGFATCPVTNSTEHEATRDLVRSLMDHDAVPQVLVRVGVVPVAEKAPRPTPRRPLSEVLRLRA